MTSELTPGLPPAASELLAGNDPAWAALEDVLRRTPAGSARDTYAHLARWHEATIVRLGDHAAGRPESLVITDFEGTNARWAAEDTRLTLDEARARCLARRGELTRLAASLGPEQWPRARPKRSCSATLCSKGTASSPRWGTKTSSST